MCTQSENGSSADWKKDKNALNGLGQFMDQSWPKMDKGHKIKTKENPWNKRKCKWIKTRIKQNKRYK